MPRSKTGPDNFIVPLNMNGLKGRMLYLPSRLRRSKPKNILMVYGQLSTIERWWGLARVFNTLGAVTMPDLPGFGGMDSFYKINKEPSIDNQADYLASFIKMRFKRSRFVLVGKSYGFIVITRMLQRYPDLSKQVELLISIEGYSDHEDFIFSKKRYYINLISSSILSRKLPALLFRSFALRPKVLKMFFTHNHQGSGRSDKELNEEIALWRLNDIRTHMYSTHELLIFTNCNKQVKLPIWHVSAKSYRFFNNHRVEQHFRVIFEDFLPLYFRPRFRSPLMFNDKSEALPLVPPKLRRAVKEA